MKKITYLIAIPLTFVIGLFNIWYFLPKEQEYTFTEKFGEEGQLRKTETKNINPYTMFGESPFVLVSDTEKDEKQALNTQSSYYHQYDRYDIQLGIGLVTLYAKLDEVALEFILPYESLAKFIPVAPRAEKHQGWSPCNYVLGNPVFDMGSNEDTIKIFHQGNELLYESGKLFLNGEEYTGKIKFFLRQTVNALDIILESPEGKSMLDELTLSYNIFLIKHAKFNPEASGKNEFVIADGKYNIQRAYANQIANDPSAVAQHESYLKAGINLSGRPEGAGGIVYWNPSGTSLITTKGIRRSAETDLAHELFHGLDANRGLMDSRKHLHPKVGRNEWQATYRENLVREQLDLPLRTHYLWKKNQTGNVVGGAGPRMLTSDQKPILPSWYKE